MQSLFRIGTTLEVTKMPFWDGNSGEFSSHFLIAQEKFLLFIISCNRFVQSDFFGPNFLRIKRRGDLEAFTM